jgi:hypothetical protein
MTSLMTALVPAHAMVTSAVRSGIAARSIPAVITGQGYRQHLADERISRRCHKAG